jgi:protein involved in polysaccharide export with SLBB domain
VVLSLAAAAPVRELRWPRDLKTSLQAGDVLEVASIGTVQRPTMALSKRIRVEGEVRKPGDYVLPAGASLRDAVAAAGGPTVQAFVFGTELNRESLRLKQTEHYERALRELEAEFTRAAVTRRERVGPPAEGDSQMRQVEHVRLIERLRQVQPTGRLVLQLSSEATELPALALEDGDRLLVPSRTPLVSVYGSVFNTGSFELREKRSLGDYLAQAGGLTRGADAEGVFVVRADGSVVSNRQSGSHWWRESDSVQKLPALPGDTVFVPEELDKLRLSTVLKDWAQILSQFGLGAVALKNLSN